jgi:hypothetical protein
MGNGRDESGRVGVKKIFSIQTKKERDESAIYAVDNELILISVLLFP